MQHLIRWFLLLWALCSWSFAQQGSTFFVQVDFSNWQPPEPEPQPEPEPEQEPEVFIERSADGSSITLRNVSLFPPQQAAPSESVPSETPEATPSMSFAPRMVDLSEDALAVVIGNQTYRHPDVPPVEFARRDASTMVHLLTEGWGLRQGNVLHQGPATLADFQRLFGRPGDPSARLHNLIQPGETDLVLYYSGHGAPDPETGEAYLIPTDADPSLLRFTGYALGDLYQNLAALPFRRLIVVIDACFSGGAESGSLLRDMSTVRIKAKNPTWEDRRVMLFTAGDLDQVATWYPDQQHSLFTYYWLQGVNGEADANGDGKLLLHELKDYLLREVPYQARRLKNRNQIPQVKGDPAQPLWGE